MACGRVPDGAQPQRAEEKLQLARLPAQEQPAVAWEVVVECSQQRAYVTHYGREVASYVVSTSRFGLGSAAGSNKTPLGRHRVAQKFGASEPIGAVFEGRVATGRIAAVLDAGVSAEEDLITTRILWLEGLEPGSNRGPGVDSKARYIYIHGTNEEWLLGRPASHGCIRMSNQDVLELFETIPVGTAVLIRE